MPADGKLWTASFGVAGLIPGGTSPDLRLLHTGGPDLCVQLLRAVRWKGPAALETGLPALLADHARLLKTRQDEEQKAIQEAMATNTRHEQERLKANPAQVTERLARLNRLRDRVMADPGKAAAQSGLDLGSLRERYFAALDLVTRGQPEATEAIQSLEGLFNR